MVGSRNPHRRVARLAASFSSLAVIAAVTLTPSLAGALLTGETFASVEAGNTNGCALTTTGTLYCWGANNYHQLDDGTTSPEDAPEALDLSPQLGSSTITSFATGNGTTCVLSSRSSVYCWGNGGQGEIGDGHFATADSPAEVNFSGQTGSIVQLIGGGSNSFCALTSTSQIWCWGDNLDGQLGNGTNSNSDTPVEVSTSGVLSGVSINSISGTAETFCALSTAGSAYCWGNGLQGALGNNAYNNSNVPVAVDMSPLGVGVTIDQIAPSNTHTCLLDSHDNVWCWGSNDAGVNGLGDPDGLNDPSSSFAIPQKVAGLEGAGTTFITSSSTESCALVSGGTLECWGADPLGDGNSAGSVLAPEPITGGDITGRTLISVSVANYATCAVDSEGSVYCWGESNYGEIGDGTTYTSVSAEEIAQSPGATIIDTVPNTPRTVAATPGDGSIAVTWIAPYSNGQDATVTGYTASATLGDATLTCSTNATTFGCTIPGLANGNTYTVSVVATNVNGNSLASGAGAITLPTVPDAPTLDGVLAASGQITVNWTAGASDGGLPISDFTASATYEAVTQTCTGQPTDTSCTITGLANGTGYTISVTATNADGNSAPSSTLVATPGVAPGVPQNVSATAGNASIAVLWAAPSSDGDSPITGYTATATAGATSTTCQGGPLATGCTITGLTNGTAYTVTVVATNQAGNSSPVGIGSYTPLSDPDAPTLVSATAGNGTIVVVWTPGASDGGETLSSFTASAKLNASSTTCVAAGTATTCTITGLTNGSTYEVSVVATSGFGPSDASNELSATPATVPSAPTLTTVTPATGSVTLSWSAPSSNGGAAVSGYAVTASPGGASCTTTTATTCTITKLTPTTGYTFSLVAKNAKGSSAPATSVVVYPDTAKVLTIELANNVFSIKQSFVAVVVGGTPGVVTTVTLPNATTQRCTLDALGQCAVTLAETKVGQYRVVAKAGAASAGIAIDVPQLIAPSTFSKGKATTVRVYYCPSGSKVTVVVAGKSYTAKAAGTGIAGLTVTITKAGTFSMVTTVGTTTISPNKTVKVG